MQNRPIAIPDYEWLASTLIPKVRRARLGLAPKAAGEVHHDHSRHHDGFSMFATRRDALQHRRLDAVQADPLKELAEECQRQGIKLFFYYSQLDCIS